MESTVRLGILTACMLLTGSVNTIATKYQVQCLLHAGTHVHVYAWLETYQHVTAQ